MEGKRIPCRIWLEVILPVFLLFNFSLGDDLSKCFFNASKKYDVNIHLLKAVAKAESGMNSYAVNINLNGKSKSYILKDRRVAERFVRYLSENDFNFDVGISQINIKNIKRFGLSPEDLLDPCKNIDISARILRELIDRHGVTWEAVWRYNGSKRYREKIFEELNRISGKD